MGNLKAAISDEAAAGELRLGAINTALHSLMPEVLAGFVKIHPTARVVIRSALSTQPYDAVLSGELDAAVCQAPRRRRPPSGRSRCWAPAARGPSRRRAGERASGIWGNPSYLVL